MPSAHPVSNVDVELAIRREDLAAAIASYRRGADGLRERVIVIGGIALALGSWMAGLASQSDAVVIGTFIGGWIILIALNMRNSRRYRSEMSRLGLACPHCSEPVVEMIEWRGLPKRADAVLATGRCPSCGGECFAAEA